MIVDYNYKPYVFNASVGITQYIPPSANNKGFICLSGFDNAGVYYAPEIDFIGPSGEIITIAAFPASPTNFWTTGSFFDLYAQFKRESTAASTGIIKSADIALYRGGSALATQFYSLAPVFFPITYSKLKFNLDGNPAGESWDVPLTIITLY